MSELTLPEIIDILKRHNYCTCGECCGPALLDYDISRALIESYQLGVQRGKEIEREKCACLTEMKGCAAAIRSKQSREGE